MAQQQGAQDHHTPRLAQIIRRGQPRLFEHETGQPFKGENLQTREPAQRVSGQQLAFELEGGLFRGQQDQRFARRVGGERGADFGEAAPGLAAAGGAEEETHLHADVFAQSLPGGKQFMQRDGLYFLFPFPAAGL